MFKKINFTILIPVVFIAILVIYFIGRSYGKNAAKVSDDKELDKDIDKNKLSYPLTSYKQMADTLHSAMLGPGTDFSSIKNVFGLIKNESDLFQLSKSFGVRYSYIDYGLFQMPYFYGTLNYWLNDELSNSEKLTLLNLLKSKNITYSF